MNKTENQSFTSISTNELSTMIDKSNVKIIDTRPIDAYNGWKMGNEKRGGHIRGAKSLPLKWIQYIDWIEIVRSKNLFPDHHLIIYGYDPEDIDAVANHFTKAGYPKIYVYYGFVAEWSRDDSKPLDRLPRYKNLVSAQWLHQLIASGNAPEFDNDKFVICHAHYQNESAYTEGHIPSSVELDTNLLESSETWNRRSSEEIRSVLEQLGITHDTTVILYGRFSYPKNDDPFPGSSAGQLGAMRCALIMLYAGVEDVRILNGGLQSWIDAGFEITTDKSESHPVSDFGASIPSHPEYIIDTPMAKEIIADPDRNLVSVRSWNEFIGKVSGYNYIEKKGRIPGAVFGNCGSDAYHMENYRNLDHTMREYHEISKLWGDVGVTPGKYNAFYCGTGWRGSEAFFYAWLMDYPNISLYDGGWFEWSNRNNPYETGPPDTPIEQAIIHEET